MSNASETAPSVLVLHGPNLNLLGEREPGIYGDRSLADLDAELVALGGRLGLVVECRQENSEGALIDALHAARSRHGAVIFNPGGYTHTSVALQDAIRAIGIPVIEVHLSNLWAREARRGRSVTGAAAAGVIMGLGFDSYALAIRHVAARVEADRGHAGAVGGNVAPGVASRARPPSAPDRGGGH